MAANAESTSSYSQLLLDSFKNGELLIFSTSLLGPFFYLALYDPEGSKAFPGRPSHATFVALLVAFCAGLFGLLRSGAAVNVDLITVSSYWLAGTAIVLSYLANLYHSTRLPDPPGIMKKVEKDFSDAVQDHRGQ